MTTTQTLSPAQFRDTAIWLQDMGKDAAQRMLVAMNDHFAAGDVARLTEFVNSDRFGRIF